MATNLPAAPGSKEREGIRHLQLNSIDQDSGGIAVLVMEYIRASVPWTGASTGNRRIRPLLYSPGTLKWPSLFPAGYLPVNFLVDVALRQWTEPVQGKRLAEQVLFDF